MKFWNDLNGVIDRISRGEKVVVGADLNGQVGEGNRGDEEVTGESVAKQHRMVVCKIMMNMRTRKRVKTEQKIKWWKLSKEEWCEDFRKEVRAVFGHVEEFPDDWETTATGIREVGRKVLGMSSGPRKGNKVTWWWNSEVQESVQRKRLAKKRWDSERTEENRLEYKERTREVKREVAKVKYKAYEELYMLDTKEREKDLYRLARLRNQAGKDVQQVRLIEDRDRNITIEEGVLRRWKECYQELLNEENERDCRKEEPEIIRRRVPGRRLIKLESMK